MSGEASTLLLEHHLKVLKLPTFVRDYKSVAAVCAQERCDYATASSQERSPPCNHDLGAVFTSP